MTKLADMKPIDQSNKAMRDAVDELCATVRALQVQGVAPDQYVALLIPLIESKLLEIGVGPTESCFVKGHRNFHKVIRILGLETGNPGECRPVR